MSDDRNEIEHFKLFFYKIKYFFNNFKRFYKIIKIKEKQTSHINNNKKKLKKTR